MGPPQSRASPVLRTEGAAISPPVEAWKEGCGSSGPRREVTRAPTFAGLVVHAGAPGGAYPCGQDLPAKYFGPLSLNEWFDQSAQSERIRYMRRVFVALRRRPSIDPWKSASTAA